MTYALALDVYGTLVNPLQIAEQLEDMVGHQAIPLAQLWRQKQLEYSFRRGLMGAYKDFSTCTREALLYAEAVLGLSLSEPQRARLFAAYQQLPPYADVLPALDRLKLQGLPVVAFSNGAEAAVKELLVAAGILPKLDGIVSVDPLKTFKPDPLVYHHLCELLQSPLPDTWLVSSNPFDIIGAKAVGCRAAWVKRDDEAVFDPWGVEPDLVISDLNSLADHFVH